VGKKARISPSQSVSGCCARRGRLIAIDCAVNDRPVGKLQEKVMNIAASFSLSKKPRFNRSVGKSQTQEGDAC
jgi:hypothetical protein